MLIVKFYQPVGIYDSILNKLCAYVTGYSRKFCHVDLIYSFSKNEMQNLLKVKGTAFLEHRRDQEKTYISFSINWGGNVEWKRLTNGNVNPLYSYEPHKFNDIQIPITSEKEIESFTWCLTQISKPYDTLGALVSTLPLKKHNQNEYDKYYCSQFVGCCLKQIGFLQENYNPCQTPNFLYHILETKKAIDASNSDISCENMA